MSAWVVNRLFATHVVQHDERDLQVERRLVLVMSGGAMPRGRQRRCAIIWAPITAVLATVRATG